MALPGSDLDKVYPIQSWVTKLKVADKKETGSEAKFVPVDATSFFSPQPALPTVSTQVVPPLRREQTHSFGLGHFMFGLGLFSSGSSSSSGFEDTDVHSPKHSHSDSSSCATVAKSDTRQGGGMGTMGGLVAVDSESIQPQQGWVSYNVLLSTHARSA